MRRWRQALGPVTAVAALWLPFVPSADPASHDLVADLRPPAIMLAALTLVALLSLMRRPLRPVLRWILAAFIVAAASLQFASALVLRVFDRGLDLYFDIPQVPSLVGLFSDAVGPVRAASAFALAFAALIGLVAAVAWALAAAERALAPRWRAEAVLGLALAGLALGVLPLRAGARPVADEGAAAVADQAALIYRSAMVMSGHDPRYDAALAAPEPKVADLAALRGHDVFLVFVESYGTAVFDNPRFRAVAAPALREFAAATQRAGYQLVSNRLVSPVFGGGSWLAHGTLESGIKLDRFLYRFLLESRRETLARYLHAAGHQTVAVMPGIKKPWPEGAFFGFERSYFAANLGYRGPPFGWFTIPDQYTFARFDAAELKPGHAPLFAEIVLVSSHTPFAPVPPYVAQWRDAGSYKSISQPTWKRIYREPDWQHLEVPYLATIAYDLKTLAGWLDRLEGAPLVIILGDHQPPGIVSGATSPWTVPVHVLSRDPALIAPFRRLGYVDGAFPPADGKVKGMESFLGDFLAGFSRGGAARAGL
ncbi:MAG TPA: hypothetical protein VMU87_08175 [Stellaceae bacterium]|nr:hypothetical protein [Stellaceae bacterium]